jgi:peptidoglycan/LPS O-acetylase OafA/YrhL
VLFSEARSPKPEAGIRAALRHSDTTFISITLIRALAIAGIIVENFYRDIQWRNAGSLSDLFTVSVATVAGTFVHMFFVLSGCGLTLSVLKKEPVSWVAWARERFKKIAVPYWVAVVVTFAVANLSLYWAPDSTSYSWATLLAYLTFLRNFYEPGQELNPAFWFMPVIIGLYILFPLLLMVMKRFGMTGLMVFSLLVSNVTIAVCVHFGYIVDHQNALPLYFVGEFSLGMVLAGIAYHQPERFRRLMGFRYFLLGVTLYALSGAMARYQLFGYGSSTYNDMFEAIGLYLMLLCICRWMSEAFYPRVLDVLNNVSRSSYIMYLIHWPIIAYVLKPVVGTWYKTNMGAFPMLLSSFAFVLLMYVLAEGISSLTWKLSVDKLTG